jgi:hypothetical protein
MMIAGSIRRRRFYQEIQNGEARSVAQSASSWCSGSLQIGRQSCGRGRWRLVEDELVDLARFGGKQGVCKMLKNMGMILAQTIGRGDDRAYQQSRNFSAAVTDRRGVICAAWRLWSWGKRGETERRWRLLYRHERGVRLGRESGELKRGNHAVSGRDIQTEVDDDDVA